MLNRVILMGRLVANPELKNTPNGVSVRSFRIAVEQEKNEKQISLMQYAGEAQQNLYANIFEKVR